MSAPVSWNGNDLIIRWPDRLGRMESAADSTSRGSTTGTIAEAGCAPVDDASASRRSVPNEGPDDADLFGTTMPLARPHRHVSPAARLIAAGCVFEWDHNLYWVERRLRSKQGRASDVLIAVGYEYADDRLHTRAIQVADIDAAIDEKDIAFPFGPSAVAFNAARGWHGHPWARRVRRA